MDSVLKNNNKELHQKLHVVKEYAKENYQQLKMDKHKYMYIKEKYNEIIWSFIEKMALKTVMVKHLMTLSVSRSSLQNAPTSWKKTLYSNIEHERLEQNED